MQDQPPTIQIPTSGGITPSSGLSPSGPGGSRSIPSVASRLKKSLNANNNITHRNASGSGHEHKCENGASESSASVPLSESDKQIVRIIGQHLKTLGMSQTVDKLLEESNMQLEVAAASRFRAHIMAGQWDMVLADLKSLTNYVSSPGDLLAMRFMVLEQKYLEFLEKGKIFDALQVLRAELCQMEYNVERVHLLSTFLMLNTSQSEFKTAAHWAGSSLEHYLPAHVMLPPKRLETLMHQAVLHQYSQCIMHNTKLPPTIDAHALLNDHTCSRLTFPCETRQILTEHCDEVWCALFSHDGRMLATGAKESVVVIWDVHLETRTLRRRHRLDGHQFGAAFFAWSPDDKYLAVVGAEDGPDLWMWNVQKGELRMRMCHSPDDSISAVAWTANNNHFVCGGQKGQFYLCDLDGNVMETWEGVRVRSLACKNDGRTVLAADTHHRIRAYSFDDLNDHTIIKENDPLIYFCLDNSERHALCTIKGQGLHLWDLETKTLTKRYRGSTHGEYIVVSCFGGVNQDFVATGSEDGKIYIWHRNGEDPVQVLNAHNSVVNAVTWNPVDACMLVSCSDDGTIKVWGPEGSEMSMQNECQMNHANGHNSSVISNNGVYPPLDGSPC